MKLTIRRRVVNFVVLFGAKAQKHFVMKSFVVLFLVAYSALVCHGVSDFNNFYKCTRVRDKYVND